VMTFTYHEYAVREIFINPPTPLSKNSNRRRIAK